MTFYFDVLTKDGFVLAGDVRLTEEIGSAEKTYGYAHKVIPSPRWHVGPKCAMAIAGEDPSFCRNAFVSAALLGSSLRDIATRFAIEWTKHFAGSEKYSGVHLVGFERYADTSAPVPQLWYWSTRAEEDTFLSQEILEGHLETLGAGFEGIPYNLHTPQLVQREFGKKVLRLPQDEEPLIRSYLTLVEPKFTWNGDTAYWRGAAGAVGSALALLRGQKPNWSLEETARLTRHCLQFVEQVSNLLPGSSVGASPDGRYDICIVSAERVEWFEQARFESDENGDSLAGNAKSA